jgi:hypothetical protein
MKPKEYGNEREKRLDIEQRLAEVSRNREAEMMRAVWILMAKWFAPIFIAFGVMVALFIARVSFGTTAMAAGSTFAFGYALIFYYDSMIRTKFAGRRRISAIYSTPYRNYFIDFIPEEIQSCELSRHDGGVFYFNRVLNDPKVSDIDELIIVTPAPWNEAIGDTQVEDMFYRACFCPIETAYVTLDEMRYVDIPGLSESEVEKKLPVPVAFMGDSGWRRRQSMAGVRRYPSPTLEEVEKSMITLDNLHSVRYREQLAAQDSLIKQLRLADRDVSRKASQEFTYMVQELERKGRVERVKPSPWATMSRARKVIIGILLLVGAFGAGVVVMALLGAL